MRFLPLLLTSALLLSSSVAASESVLLKQTEELKAGLSAMRSGDKSLAWELMFPQAQAGDVQAMFHLGQMMLTSPEYGDHLERAIKFFTVAASKGHAGAKQLLPRVKEMLETKANLTAKTIAGKSGLPTQEEIGRAHKELAKYKAEVLRFTDNLPTLDTIPRIEVMVFMQKPDANAERLYSMTQALEKRFGNKIRTKYFMVINPAEWTPSGPPIGGSSLPPSGFTPDFKGSLAAKHGVRNLPAVVVLPPSGQPRVVDDLSSVSNLITSML